MDKLDDDEEFCAVEYDAVQEYCEKYQKRRNTTMRISKGENHVFNM